MVPDRQGSAAHEIRKSLKFIIISMCRHTTMAMEIIIMGTMELMMEAQFHTIRIIKTNRIMR